MLSSRYLVLASWKQFILLHLQTYLINIYNKLSTGTSLTSLLPTSLRPEQPQKAAARTMWPGPPCLKSLLEPREATICWSSTFHRPPHHSPHLPPHLPSFLVLVKSSSRAARLGTSCRP